MKKFYATITRHDGTSKEIGAWSEKELQKDLRAIHEMGIENLDECAVYVYSVEC